MHALLKPDGKLKVSISAAIDLSAQIISDAGGYELSGRATCLAESVTYVRT